MEQSRKNSRCYVYLRVSSVGQVEGDGFERQLIAVRSYAQANGIKIAKIFREEGVSGTKDLENRPALRELLTALHADGVKLVLIEKLDRLARDLMIQESIIADLNRHGFEIRSVAEPDLCSGDPSRTLIRQISLYERAIIVLKLRGARQRMRAKVGRCEGRKPYGTRPGESEVIARMRQLRSQGQSLTRITETLNLDTKPRTGKQFYAANVGRILKNAALHG
jgi:DNA invertase Pin-like site-specific DNA recombinase